ncbi:hypothetical protein WT24_13950, partial [Burkholderia sp. MSMB1078WGS]
MPGQPARRAPCEACRRHAGIRLPAARIPSPDSRTAAHRHESNHDDPRRAAAGQTLDAMPGRTTPQRKQPVTDINEAAASGTRKQRPAVGISLFARDGQAIWENGIHQNIAFLAMMLKRSDRVGP